jgi:hypothetical protein
MYKLFLAAVIALALSLSTFTQAATYGGGGGTAEDPYQIWTPEQMNTIGANSADWGKHFKLMADIDMSIYTGTQYNIIGNEIKTFYGTFDGQEHVIRNLTYYSATTMVAYVGLFGYASQATIRNVGIENVNINALGSYVGGLVGDQNSGTITNCYSTGSVTNSYHSSYAYAGGLVGGNGVAGTIATITSCYSTSAVSGYSGVGGLTGGNAGTITSCYAAGTVTGGTVTGSGENIGGLVGYYPAGTITSCYATGTVTGRTYVGGLVGSHISGTITSCYAVGAVSGVSNVGGFCGRRISGGFTNCFWDTETSGTSDGVGNNIAPDPNGVIGKTTAEMQTLSTFTSAGWDFVGETANGTNDTWWMRCEGMNYPRLSWQSLSDGDLVCPDGVTMVDFSYLSQNWLLTTCTADNNYCGGADMNFSGIVDLDDLSILAANWMRQ